MKQLLIILLTLFSLQSFAQQKYVVKVQGTPGITKAQLDSTANLKLAITDTTNKWVNTLANNATNDSLIYWVGSVRHAIKVVSNQVNSDWNASTGAAQILNKPAIPSATSQLTNDAGFITSSAITGKINYTDSSSMLSPYLRKVDTTGKWISPAVANATYATITNLNLKLDKSDSTIANRVTNLQNTKANDNNVIHPTGNETASSKWLNNSYIALGGELSDLGMTGLFDRNELTNADLMGTVTVTQYTSGAASDVSSLASALFDASGNFSAFPQTSGSSDSLKILIDLGANVSNYNAGYWQPFVAFRLPNDLFKNIKVETSIDNVSWTTSNTPASWSFNSTSQTFFPTGYWMGAKDYQANLASTWRYIRFTFKNPSNTDPYVYISEIGMRHSSAPYARQYLLKAGDNIYGRINLQNKATTMGYIDPLTGTFNGIFSGNSTSATKLQTARNINGVPFDGTSNITVTDASKEPTITAGTTSQFWRGDKTWQNFSTLPVSTATQTALNAKLDTSYRDIWSTVDPFVSDTINKILLVRQSFVDSIRNAMFSGISSWLLNGNTDTYARSKAVGYTIADSLAFKVTGYSAGLITNNGSNTGIGFLGFTKGNASLMGGTFNTWIGTNAGSGQTYSYASNYFGSNAKASFDSAKWVTVIGTNARATKNYQVVIGKQDSTQETQLFGLIKTGSDTLATNPVVRTLATSIVDSTLSIKNRDYANDSVAVTDGNLQQWDFYRTGNVVKIVSVLPNFVLTYTVNYSTGTNDSTQFKLQFRNGTDKPLGSGVYPSVSVDWGDGVINNFTTQQTQTPTHKYTTNGTYTVRINLGINGGSLVDLFWVNNFPYKTKVTKVGNLGNLTAATDIELYDAQSIDSTTYDFAYPSTLKTLALNNTGIINFHPTHNLPSGLTVLKLDHNSLTTAEVNNTLVWLNGQTFTSPVTIDVSQSGTAPPTGAGLTALSSLRSKGDTVTTD